MWQCPSMWIISHPFSQPPIIDAVKFDVMVLTQSDLFVSCKQKVIV